MRNASLSAVCGSAALHSAWARPCRAAATRAEWTMFPGKGLQPEIACHSVRSVAQIYSSPPLIVSWLDKVLSGDSVVGKIL